MPELYKESDGRFSVRVWIEPNRHGTPRIRIRFGYKNGEVRTDTAKTEAEALITGGRLWQAHIDGLLDAPVEAPDTLGELIELFLQRDLAPATKKSYQQVLYMFKAYVGAEKTLNHIGKTLVAKWFAEMTCKPVSQAAYLRTISALFAWAKSKKYIDQDPTTDQTVERFHTVIRPWMQATEWPEFLAKCGKGHRIRAEFTLHTGLRASELANARWSWLHGTVGRPAITVPVSKSARARAIPLSARAVEVLELAKKQWPDQDHKDGKIFGQMLSTNLRRDTVKACTAAKVTICDFHGLRRSCGARWLELGIPLFHVSRLLGHADVSTTAKHYAGLADSTLAAEIDKVDLAALVPPPSNVVRLRTA